jgi:hypothetical protein
MSNKSRRHRHSQSADPKEIEARTGVAPAPGEVVSKKAEKQIINNRARAKMKADAAVAALNEGDFARAGALFKEAMDAANLAQSHKMKTRS